MKKTLSLVLALVMVALMLPVAAFTTSADDPYYSFTDFTKATPDDGTDGTITDSLPTGWVANDDPEHALSHKAWTTTLNYDWKEKPHSVEKDTYEDEVKYIGVRFGGANQGIAMTDAAAVPAKILNAEVDYTITVKWNTTHKFAHIRFGWSGEAVPTKTTIAATQHVAFNYTGGPSNAGGAQEAYGDGEGKGGNWMFNGTYAAEYLNEYGSNVKWQYVFDSQKDAVIAGSQVTTTFEIVGGKVVAIYNEIGGTTVKYPASADVAAKGYFSIWLTNWGDNNTANVQSVQIKEGTMNHVQFPEVSNTEILSSVDFTTIKTDAALEDSGFAIYKQTIDSPDTDKGYINPYYEYSDKGLVTKLGSGDFMIQKGIELNNTDAYIIDYTFSFNPAVHIFSSSFGYSNDQLNATDPRDALNTLYTSKLDGNSFKIRSTNLAIDSCQYYTDGQYMTVAPNEGGVLPSSSALQDATGDTNTTDNTNVDVRVRLLVSKGTGQYAFITIGDEHFYVKKKSPFTQDSIAGYFGFTWVGSAKTGRGVTFKNFSISRCDLGDTTGGDIVPEEKEKAYTDAAATYYKDGYLLHYMDFAAEGLDWEGTGYSFASNSSKERIVKVENDVLKFTNTGSKPAYLMFTANAIPAAITEYTATYSFRFVGEVNNYFGFIRGISLKDDDSKDEVETVELKIKGEGEINDFETADTAAWEAIVAAMKAGEWVSVTVSNVGRYVESVTVVCGENTATFKMDPEENKVAPDGYMGFIIGASTSVEVQGVAIMAGKAGSFTEPIVPTGTEAGALVQDVLAEAVAEGTKPDYSALIEELTKVAEDTPPVGPDDPEPEQTTTVPAATTTTKTEEKKGCKGSLVAVPAIIATAIIGCAVVCKKKED